MKKNYQRKEHKSNHKCEVVRGQELLVQVPLPMAEVWAEMQTRVEELAGQAGLQILRAILENEVTRRVGRPHRPNPSAGCVRWGKQPGYVVFGGQKVPVERPRVRTREGQEVELESYAQVAARREAATCGAGRHGGGAVHAELPSSGGECSGGLRDREKQREPAVCRRQQPINCGRCASDDWKI